MGVDCTIQPKRRDRRVEVREDCHRQAWITTAEAAHISGLSLHWIRDLCESGKIRTRHFGAYRVDHESLQRYLAG